jgi:hypothetical protein
VDRSPDAASETGRSALDDPEGRRTCRRTCARAAGDLLERLGFDIAGGRTVPRGGAFVEAGAIVEIDKTPLAEPIIGRPMAEDRTETGLVPAQDVRANVCLARLREPGSGGAASLRAASTCRPGPRWPSSSRTLREPDGTSGSGSCR